MTENEDIAAELDTLLGHGADEAAVRAKVEARRPSPALSAIWSSLQHFLDDADIRGKDGEDRAMQEGEFRKLIQWLRDDAPVEQLRRVTFLWPA